MFKKKVTIIMATLLLALLVFPIAFAAEVTFELSTDIAWPEDSVKVSGTADPETWVSIKVIDNDSEIVFFDATKSDADGNYSLTFKVPFVKPGTLTVVAGYKAKVATGKLIVPGALTDIGGHWAEADIIALVEKGLSQATRIKPSSPTITSLGLSLLRSWLKLFSWRQRGQDIYRYGCPLGKRRYCYSGSPRHC